MRSGVDGQQEIDAVMVVGRMSQGSEESGGSPSMGVDE